MKKLLVTASTFPRYMDDTEPRFIYDLCKEYTKYFDVTVLVPAAPGAEDKEEMEGMHVIRYHYFPVHKLETLCYPGAIVPRIKEKKSRGLLVPFLFLSMHHNIKKIIKEYDYVHSNWFIPQGIVQRKFKTPYILTGLGGDVTSLNKGIVKKWKADSLKKASYITVVSKDLKEKMKTEFNIDNAEIIPMGCSIEKFTPDNYKDNCFNQEGKKVILFVGRLVEKKGAEYLIDAMKDIDAQLVIVGDGPIREKLKERAANLGKKVVFVGPKNKQELAPMYASCDVFCAPSVVAKDGDKDGLPVAIVEAMASGAAVVASELGGISEIIEDGKNGFLTKPKDVTALKEKINKLLEDKELNNKISVKAREKALEYDFAVIGRRYRDIINSKL